MLVLFIMKDEVNDIRQRKHKRRFAILLRNKPTKPEAKLWQHLKKRQMKGCKFRRQSPIGKYIVDFLCIKSRLVIEVDGSSHKSKQEYDQQRDQYLYERNYTVLRFSNKDIENNIEHVLETIKVLL